MKSGKNCMKASVSKGEVSLLPVSGAGWEVTIGCERASSTAKRGFATAKWLADPGGGKIIKKIAKYSSFTS
jgi:hypothetical protein